MREHNTYLRGTFVSDDCSDALSYAVAVGKENEYVNYVQDLMIDGTLADLDPLNQMIMLEEMEQYEAMQLLSDLYRKIKGNQT